MASVELPVARVFLRGDARRIDDEAVRGLIGSIREVGIINPLRVRARGDDWEVTAGAHRLRAASKLGLETVPCIVVEDDDLHAELAMIDENLCRAELSSAERAKQTARRKAIYVELHPETRHGTPGVSRQVGETGERSENVVRFTADTAERTGKSERAVQRDAERGEAIDPGVLDMIRGSHLDTGLYLDRLKRLEPKEQLRIAARDLANPPAKRKPVAPSDAPRNDFEVVNTEHAALVRAWERAGPEARDRFLADIGAVIDRPVMDRRFG